MIPRYTRKLGHIWSERNEFDTMLLVKHSHQGQAELGVIPKERLKPFVKRAIDVGRIREIEKETNLISFPS